MPWRGRDVVSRRPRLLLAVLLSLAAAAPCCSSARSPAPSRAAPAAFVQAPSRRHTSSSTSSTSSTRERIRWRRRRGAGLMASSPLDDFMQRLDQSLVDETFVRLSLANGGKAKGGSKAAAASSSVSPPPAALAGLPPGIDKLQARLVASNEAAAMLQLVVTHPFSSTTKNVDPASGEGPAAVRWALEAATAEGAFKAARLFTTGADWVLEAARKEPTGLRLYRNKPTFTAVEVGAHDRAKKRRLAMVGVEDGAVVGGEEALAGGAPEAAAAAAAGSGFLRAYGIVGATGRPTKGMGDKVRQIEKFVEILEAQLKAAGLDSSEAEGDGDRRRRLRLLDAGCGRGLLTFAAFEFLTKQGYDVEARGVDLRKDVVDKANAVAASLGYSPSLSFLQGSIGELVLQRGKKEGSSSSSSDAYDIVVALHACDTATDDALHLGVAMGARVILSSPCCHKEVRRQMARSSSGGGGGVLGAQQAPVVRHGILLERQAELVTDAVRVLCLEAAGYRSQVMEFINDEATSKNLMITATRKQRSPSPASASAKRKRDEAEAQLRALLGYWGVGSQRLVRLLGLLEDEDEGET